MSIPVKKIPEGYHSVTPYLSIQGASKAIEFYKKAFNAVEVLRIPRPDGKLTHAEIKIGDSHVMMADESAEMGNRSAKTLGGSPIGLMLYVENVDSTVEKAIAQGAKLKMPVTNQFYGDRSGAIEDLFGFTWHISTHIEDVAPEELKKRAYEWTKKNFK